MLTTSQTEVIVRTFNDFLTPTPGKNFRSLALFTDEIKGSALEQQERLIVNTLESAKDMFDVKGKTFAALTTIFSQQFKPEIVYVFRWCKAQVSLEGAATETQGRRVLNSLSDFKKSDLKFKVALLNKEGYAVGLQTETSQITVDTSSSNITTFSLLCDKLTESIQGNTFNTPEIEKVKSKLKVVYDDKINVFKCTYNSVGAEKPFAIFIQDNETNLTFGFEDYKRVTVKIGKESQVLPKEELLDAFNKSLDFDFYYGVGFVDELKREELEGVLKTIEAMNSPRICYYQQSDLSQYQDGGAVDYFHSLSLKRSIPVYSTTKNADLGFLAFWCGQNYSVKGGFGGIFGKHLVNIPPENISDLTTFNKYGAVVYALTENAPMVIETLEQFNTLVLFDYIQDTAQKALNDQIATNSIDIGLVGHSKVKYAIESVILDLANAGAIIPGVYYGTGLGNIKHGDVLEKGYYIYYDSPMNMTQTQYLKAKMQTFSVVICPIRYARRINVNIRGNI